MVKGEPLGELQHFVDAAACLDRAGHGQAVVRLDPQRAENFRQAERRAQFRNRQQRRFDAAGGRLQFREQVRQPDGERLQRERRGLECGDRALDRRVEEVAAEGVAGGEGDRVQDAVDAAPALTQVGRDGLDVLGLVDVELEDVGALLDGEVERREGVLGRLAGGAAVRDQGRRAITRSVAWPSSRWQKRSRKAA